MAEQGVFINFEGIDGAGKSSHVEALAERLRSAGRRVVVTREPGGTPLAERLRDLVLQQSMDGLTEALLVFAARRDHLLRVILPAVRRGDVVISDRFTDSSFAYQGGGQGLSPAILRQLEQWVQAREAGAPPTVFQPDLTLWFDLPPAQAAERLAHARSPDRFEARGEDFFARVRAGYAARALAAPGRFVRIDAAAERDAVWQAVLAAVRERGWSA